MRFAITQMTHANLFNCSYSRIFSPDIKFPAEFIDDTFHTINMRATAQGPSAALEGYVTLEIVFSRKNSSFTDDLMHPFDGLKNSYKHT